VFCSDIASGDVCVRKTERAIDNREDAARNRRQFATTVLVDCAVDVNRDGRVNNANAFVALKDVTHASSALLL
jgi:hypothetical protein